MLMKIQYGERRTPPAATVSNAPGPAGTANISQAELEWIMDEHHRYLSRRRGSRAILRSAKLDGLTMANRDLSEANLSGASLVGANLHGTNLARASLYCADLRDCDLRNARLEYADLRGTSFNGADLDNAVLSFADLRPATVLHLGTRVMFQGNIHEDVPIGAVDFTNASLRNVSFLNARLDHANFADALLEGAMFRGASLGDACFRGATLWGVDLEELNVPSAALRNCLPSPSIVAQGKAKHLLAEILAHHEWFVSQGKRGRTANIDGTDLRPLADSLRGLCLAGLSARRVVAVSVDFSGCQMQAARFDGADLRGANFTDADLSGASLQRARLAHVSFRNTRIEDLVLSTGQILHFRADKPEGVPHRIGADRIRTGSFIDGLDEQRVA